MKKIKTLFLLITLLASFSFGAAWTGANSEPESTQTIDGKKFYVITTPEELAWFAAMVYAGYDKMNAVLANDIVFGEDTASVNTEYAWTPIGKDSEHAFKGILDGAGYSIYGVWTDSKIEYGGLVGRLDATGVVRNVNMKRDSINANKYAGGVVGYNYGGAVSDCTNEGSVTGGYSFYAGGVVGYNYGGAVSDCTNEGSVSSSSYAGGVVGYNDRGTVSDCANEGGVTATGYNNDSYAGGIVGYNYLYLYGSSTVSGCTNSGSVTATSSDYYNDSYAGGIVGRNRGTVSGCTNSGSVTATSSDNDYNDSYAGGVVGYNYGGAVSDCTNEGSVTGGYSFYAGGVVGYNYGGAVSDCTNEGTVTGSNAGGVVGYNDRGTVSDCANEGGVTATGSNNDSYAGGIVGYNYLYLYGSSTVSGCTNSGSVTATSSDNDYNNDSYAGGVVGYNYSGALVSGCTNEGSVSSSSYAGGVVGYNDRGTVSDCANEGGVTATGYNAGGIVGRNRGTVSGCTNSGSVTATGSNRSYAGGIVGYNYLYLYGSSTVSGCTNSGSVTATGSNRSYAGGIVGGNDGTVWNCTNEGSVTASDTSKYSYAGGIIGYNRGSEALVKNSYSRTDTLAFMGDGEANKYGEAYRGGVAGVNADSAQITNCYYDSDELPGVSAIGSNSATATDVSGMTTANMQRDQFAWILNTTNGSEKNSGVWSRNGGYPIFANAENKAIYRVVFFVDSTEFSNRYTDYRALTTLPSAPEPTEGYMFSGWYSYKFLGNSGDTIAVTGDLDLFAKYEEIKFSSSSANSSSSASSSSGVANSSSSASSSSSVAGSSSSSGSTALHVTAQPRFNLQVQNRTIWVQNARVGESFAVFDVQGHVLRRGVVNSAELFLSVQNAGAYIVRMGTETMRVRVK